MIIATIVLLLIAASRIAILQDREFNYDEVLNAYRTGESLSEALNWVPSNWTPLHFMLLWGWQALAGGHPVVLRFSSVLLMMLASVFLFRASRHVFKNDQTAWFCTLIFASFGYSLYLSTYIRGYILLLALYPLAFWLMLRYLDKPSLKRAAFLSLIVAACFYTSVTAVIAFIPLVLYAFIVYGKQAWCGWIPAVGTGILIAPELLDKALAVTQTVQGTEAAEAITFNGLSVFDDFFRFFSSLTGIAAPVWLSIGAILIVVVLIRYKTGSRTIPALLVWGFAVPLGVWLIRPYVDLFSNLYIWWEMFGLALLLGYAMMRIPRIVSYSLVGLLVIGLFLPLPVRSSGTFNLPFESSFRILQETWRTGDVLLIDPNCVCGSRLEWRYFQSVYFPNGLDIVDEIGDQRRIWYLTQVQAPTPEIIDTLVATRAGGKFFGPPGFFFRVFEAPPNPEGIAFANGMRFHGAQVTDPDGHPLPDPIVYREGETVTLRLWWSTDQVLEADYSIGLHLRNEDGAIAQSDGGPQLVFPDNAPDGTSQWSPDNLYISEHTLTIPAEGLRWTSNFTVYLTVYQWWDGMQIDAPNRNEDGLLPLFPIHVMVW